LVKGGPGIDGCTFRILTVINGFIITCLAIVVARRLNSDDARECWTELFVRHGPPDHNRSDNGAEFTAMAVRVWLGRVGSRASTSSQAVPGRTATTRV
jgi:transposase InsO family protein